MSKKHVHIAASTETPEHSFAEKVHTPRRASLPPGATVEEWDRMRHAHVDDAVASPSGLVPRVPTPLRTPKGDVSDFPVAPPNHGAKKQRTARIAIPAFVAGTIVGAIAATLLLKLRR